MRAGGRDARLENLVGTPQWEETQSLAERLDHVALAVEAMQNYFEELSAETNKKYTDVMADMCALTDALKAKVQGLEEELSLVKKALRGHHGGGDAPLKVKVPDPKSFSGTRNAKARRPLGYGGVLQGCSCSRGKKGKNHQHLSHRGCQTLVEKTDGGLY